MQNEITKTKFNKFLHKGKLTRPKTKIAKHFGISVKVLYKWMRLSGYSNLIGVKKGAPIPNIKKPEIVLNIQKDSHGNKMIEWPLDSGIFVPHTKEKYNSLQSEVDVMNSKSKDSNEEKEEELIFELKKKEQ